MGILSWLYGKGIAGAISTDLVKKYLAIKSRHPGENEDEILNRVWDFWLTLNEEHIQTEDSIDKKVRLEIINEKKDSKNSFGTSPTYQSLFDLYQDILYIETEISITDGKTWNNTMIVFLKIAKKYDLDFSKEYESCKRVQFVIQ